MKRIPSALAATAIVALLAIALTTSRQKNMDSSNAARKQLLTVLGAGFASVLDGAEVIAFAPDPDYQPRKYFVVREMTLDEFRAWAKQAQIKTGAVPNVPPSVWHLPETAKLSRWITTLKGDAQSEEGGGSLPSAMIWSRWTGGVTCTVIQPSY